MSIIRPNPTLHLLPPDYTEERNGNHLLIWRDLPRWVVVDTELYNLLHTFTTERSAALSHTHRKTLKPLIQAGVLVDPNGPKKDRALRTPGIQNIALNLTRRCNLRCRFCYNLDKLVSDEAGELSAREILNLLKSARRFTEKKPSLVILGGEPLVEPDKLLEVCAGAIRLGFTPLVSTNGTLVTDDFTRRARSLRLQVQVSLDGHTAELNDLVRGKGSFDRAVDGIRTLVQGGAYTIVSMVCHQGTLPYLEEFYDFCLRLGVNEARFIPLKQLGGAGESGFKPAPTTDIIHQTYTLLQRRPELLQLMGRDAFTILGNTCRFSTPRPSCGTGCQTFLLDSDGSLYPCLNTNLPEFRIANTCDPGFDFARVWHDSPVLGNIRRLSSVNQPCNDCSQCVVKHWCLGSCHGETHAVTGDMSRRSPNCADSRRAIIEMFWILAERPDLVKKADTIC